MGGAVDTQQEQEQCSQNCSLHCAATVVIRLVYVYLW
jgi:hypothetical protein